MIFNATDLQGFTLEISDREIYNDIRAECDISEILTLRPDATPEFFDLIRVRSSIPHSNPLVPGETRDFTVYAESEHIEIVWQTAWAECTPVSLRGLTEAECYALGGEAWWYPWGNPSIPSMCELPNNFAKINDDIVQRAGRYIVVEVTNRGDWSVIGSIYAEYLGLTPEKRYLKLRSVDETSIAKYGRRVMDLIWPLGQHPNTMQSMLDSYCARYSEPVCMARMTLEGSDDAKITQLLSLKVEDKHQIIHPRLDMDEEFFINNLNVSYQREGDNILRGVYNLEQVRASEELTLFLIGSSLIGGAHVIAP